MQFKLTDLMWFTAYFAVGAWLYSLGWGLGVSIWLGTVFGFEIGVRSDYPTLLLAICGSVLGLAASMAIYFTSIAFSHAKLFMYFDTTITKILVVITWLVTTGIFLWLATRLRKRPEQPKAASRIQT